MNRFNRFRRKEAFAVRTDAAEMASSRPHPRHIANDDEHRYPCYPASFTKGMPHDYDTGLISNPQVFVDFIKAIDSGDPRDFKDVALGPSGGKCKRSYKECKCHVTEEWESKIAQCLPKCERKGKEAKVRAWESQSAGNAFDLEGPDAQSVTMPPAPALDSDELVAEMAEVYAQALLRDYSFEDIDNVIGGVAPPPNPCAKGDNVPPIKEVIDCLKDLEFYNKVSKCCKKGANNRNRFRGNTYGDDVGPYISQFLLIGNTGLNRCDKEPDRDQDSDRSEASGRIAFGALDIDQRVRVAEPCKDYMTTWNEWFDVQQGADVRGQEDYANKPPRRFIATPRDLATYVHYDALYQAYLNACLIMLGSGVPFDPGIPFQEEDCIDHQQGFALFGPPHILTLVTEVATRALKAVRFQKFNVHRRMRPEVLAARLHNSDAVDKKLERQLERKSVEKVTLFGDMAEEPGLKCILGLINGKNGGAPGGANYLLPMAYPEGSPMHPSYGAGHATVAGACVTILKAFFDTKAVIPQAYIPNPAAGYTTLIPDPKNPLLTVEGELNKLASNISIGRNWAGVHFYSDYIESIRLGEQIAIGILEEQKLTYHENFSMTVPLFDGGAIRI